MGFGAMFTLPYDTESTTPLTTSQEWTYPSMISHTPNLTKRCICLTNCGQRGSPGASKSHT